MELTIPDNLTAESWDHVRSRLLDQVATAAPLPGTIRGMLDHDLGTLRGAANGDTPAVTSDLTAVTEDYLEFLRRQISLNARGDAWTAVLSDRLRRLAPYLGRPLLRVTVRSPEGSLTARFDPSDYELIHWELD